MAGIQSCFRKFVILNSSRLIKKNGILLQPSRGRHFLVLHIASPQNRIVLQATKLQNLRFRLASTNVTIPSEAVLGIPKPDNVIKAVQVNSAEAKTPSIVESELPPAPSELQPTEPPDMEFILTGLKEPTFESLGLGSNWPPGLVQQLFEFLHINLDLPWWQAIVLVTFVIRMLLMPVVLSARKNGIHMSNNLPKIQAIQKKILDSKLRGDFYAVATHTAELQKFIKDNGINMFAFAKVALIQAPIFFSMYSGLTGMAEAPVESLKTEGLLWFQDLTVVDPYYILPLYLSCSLLAIIEVGAEGYSSKQSGHTVKWVMRGFPILILFFTTRCSSCVTWYWAVSNTITLAQSALLKIPSVKKALNIPEIIKPPQDLMPPKKGFIEGFKEGIENSKIQYQVLERERMKAISFEKAGTGPVPRTFKKNPLAQKVTVKQPV